MVVSHPFIYVILGGTLNGTTIITDANTANSFGLYYVVNGGNCPENHYFLFVFCITKRVFQFAFPNFTYTNNQRIFYRRSADDGNLEGRTWTEIAFVS